MLGLDALFCSIFFAQITLPHKIKSLTAGDSSRHVPHICYGEGNTERERHEISSDLLKRFSQRYMQEHTAYMEAQLAAKSAQVAMATLVYDFLRDIDTRINTGELNVRTFSRMSSGEIKILLTVIVEECVKKAPEGSSEDLHNTLVKVLRAVVSNSDDKNDNALADVSVTPYLQESNKIDLQFHIDLSQDPDAIRQVMKSICQIATLYDDHEGKGEIGQVWVEFIHNAQSLGASRGICYTPHANRKKYSGSWGVGGWDAVPLHRHPFDYAIILKSGLEKRK